MNEEFSSSLSETNENSAVRDRNFVRARTLCPRRTGTKSYVEFKHMVAHIRSEAADPTLCVLRLSSLKQGCSNNSNKAFRTLPCANRGETWRESLETIDIKQREFALLGYRLCEEHFRLCPRDCSCSISHLIS